jgi:spore coat polysaccharide biosynthesis predicted glycosyltransferase SpsG
MFESLIVRPFIPNHRLRAIRWALVEGWLCSKMVILDGRHTPENYLPDGCIGKTHSPSAANASYRSYKVDYRCFHQIPHAVLRKAFYTSRVL